MCVALLQLSPRLRRFHAVFMTDLGTEGARAESLLPVFKIPQIFVQHWLCSVVPAGAPSAKLESSANGRES